VHFTALQEGRQPGEKTDFVKYCQAVPYVGKIYLTIDLLDRDVRSTPISLRVIEENIVDGRPPEIKTTLSETPPKIYKNGTADTHVNITEPGHYALIANVGDGPASEDDRLRIPFTVALAPQGSFTQTYGKVAAWSALLFFGIAGFIGYRAYQKYRPANSHSESDVKNAAGAKLG
jgi:hypothetical protein